MQIAGENDWANCMAFLALIAATQLNVLLFFAIRYLANKRG